MTRFHTIASSRIRIKRMVQAERLGIAPINFYKRSPHDCGRSNCSICHSVPRGHPRRRGL